MLGFGRAETLGMSDLPSSITVNSRKYGGELKRSWTVRPLKVESDRLELFGEFDLAVRHRDLGLIRRGTISYEYFWLDRWYNIFRFHESDGTLKFHYCNIIMPPAFAGNTVNYIDLDIDVLVWPDMSFRVLDEEEFEDNIRLLNYPANIVVKARETTEAIVSAIAAGQIPTELK